MEHQQERPATGATARRGAEDARLPSEPAQPSIIGSKLEAALDAAQRGLPVFRLPPGKKKKPPARFYEIATTDEATIRAWWTETPDANIGILTDDFVVLDIDVRPPRDEGPAVNGVNAALQLGLTRGDWNTLAQKTPSGGAHYVWRAPEGMTFRGSAGQLGIGLDVRAFHNYIVWSGSTFEPDDNNPGTAGLYRVKPDRDVPVAPVPAKLAALLEAPSKRATDQSRVSLVQLDQPANIAWATNYLKHDAAPAVDGSRGDNRTYLVACVLKDHGVSEGEIYQLLSAHYNERCLPPWTEDELEEKARRAYAHGTSQPGCACPEVNFAGIAIEPPTDDAIGAIGAIGANGSNGAWDEPDLSLLDGPSVPAPAFPFSALGPWAPWCTEIAESRNAPIDYIAAGLLTIAAALIGNARTAAVGTWDEPPVLWTALVGPPSSGKSPALDPLRKILHGFEAEWAKAYSDRLRVHEAAALSAKRRRADWEALVKQGDATASMELPADAQIPETPERPRLAISDATIEAAAQIASGNPKGLLLDRDELAGWWRAFDRYAKGGSGESQFWLHAYGARSHRVDRKSNPKPILVPRLAICVLGGTQPEVVASLVVQREADGLTARILWVYPEPTRGFRIQDREPDSNAIRAAMARLWALQPQATGGGSHHPIACGLTPDAARVFEPWWSRVRDQANDELGSFGEWLGKGGGLALRLALVLEHLWWAYESATANSANSANSGETFDPFAAATAPVSISLKAIQCAITLVEDWAAPMARRVFGAAAASEAEQDAAQLARWLRRKGCSSFNARDVRRAKDGPAGRLSPPKAMNAACQALEQAGIIRPEPVRAGDTPGRSRLDYVVNPALFG